MALFGKKKKAEQAAPQTPAQDDPPVVDDDEVDIEDGGGQVIDFDAIEAELTDDDGESVMGEPLGAATTAATPFDDDAFGSTNQADDFAATANFGAENAGNAGLDADDELDFDSVFDDGTPATEAPATGAPTVASSAAMSDADENPFGDASVEASPFGDVPASGGIAIEPDSEAPPLTYTAPLLTSDAVATAGVPATRRSLPLPLILGVLGLLIALGAVGYLMTQGNSESEEPAVAINSSRRSPKTGAAAIDLMNQRAVVDGVPIAPGVVGGSTLVSVGPKPTVPLTPTLLKKLKDLWKQGAVAKGKGDIAGARAAWTKMLQLRPYHPGVQSAIDKLGKG